ncbi:ERF family protein [Lactobacillus delbrueckii subsp. bulgaricus]
MQHSDSTKELWEAFAKFRAQVKQPQKTANNPYFNSKYVTLEGVMQAIDAALPGTGLAYSQLVENGDNGVSVSTLITHTSGEWMIVGPLTLNPTKRDPQGHGSAITYAKRYQLASAFGISSDIDDDGNAGTFGEDKQSGYQRHSAPKNSYRGQSANQGNHTSDHPSTRQQAQERLLSADEAIKLGKEKKYKEPNTQTVVSAYDLLTNVKEEKERGEEGDYTALYQAKTQDPKEKKIIVSVYKAMKDKGLI